MPKSRTHAGARSLSKPKTEQEFNEVLLQAIDEALVALGEKTKAALYFHLKQTFALSKKDIPNHVSDFTDALEKIFGHGAEQIELLIMKSLNKKVQAVYKWSGPKWLVPDLTFTKYVKLMWLECIENEETDMEVILDVGEQEEEEA
jgi:hypothetical protein